MNAILILPFLLLSLVTCAAEAQAASDADLPRRCEEIQGRDPATHTAEERALLRRCDTGLSAGSATGPLQECHRRQVERWQGVTHYVVDQSMMGQRVTLGYERFEAPGPDGTLQPAFRPMTSEGPFSSQDLELFAQGARDVGRGLSDEMNKSGLPVGMLGEANQDPWASTDPKVMMGGAATFAEAAAEAQKANAREREAAVGEASRDMAAMQELGRQLRHVGKSSLDSRAADHYRAAGLDRRISDESGAQMVIQQVDLWIDSRECVPLRLLMAGTMTAEGQTKPITIERLDSDYAPVPGSKMYEPRRQVMRMKGVLTPEQERQMAESRQKLAEVEAKLAEVPPGQRDMIMRQMGPQLEMMRNMSSGGGIEVVTEVHSILVNPDSAALASLRASSAGPGTGVFALPAGAAAGAAPTQVPTAASAAAAVAAPGAVPPDQAAQQACLQQKIRERQEMQKKKQGIGRLVSAVGRMAGQLGGSEVVRAVGEAQNARATAEDLAIAARELGITEDEIAACQGDR
jgi:hypothetical protein